MYTFLLINIKWLESVKLLRTIRIAILNESTHYLWLIISCSKVHTNLNNYDNYIKCMYTSLLINIMWFESVELFQTITITILTHVMCTSI